jgi:threonine/homoserine/homoserine lactone efflux protein
MIQLKTKPTLSARVKSMPGIFLQSLFIAFSGALMPGPMLTYTIEMSLKRGVRAGILIPLGHALLEAVVAIALLTGAGAFLTKGPFKAALGLVGGLVLLYLGLGMIRDVVGRKLRLDFSPPQTHKYNSMFFGGVLISLANPYFTFWWAAVGLGLITSAYVALGIRGAVLFYLGHILADFAWYFSVSFLVAKSKTLINLKVYLGIILLLGAAMIFFGINFFLTGIRESFPL